MISSETTLVRKLRRVLDRHGYSLHKSNRPIDLDNLGGYMIVDLRTDGVVSGNRFDNSLEDVEEWVKDNCSE